MVAQHANLTRKTTNANNPFLRLINSENKLGHETKKNPKKPASMKSGQKVSKESPSTPKLAIPMQKATPITANTDFASSHPLGSPVCGRVRVGAVPF